MINIDGAAAAYRLPFLMLGGSLVLLQNSPFYEHWNVHFIPNQHFIPVKRDFSDLLEKLEWARQHDSEARAIAVAGVEAARKIVTPESVFSYTEQMLLQYTQRLAFTPTVHPEMTRVLPSNDRHHLSYQHSSADPPQHACQCAPPPPPPHSAAVPVHPEL